ncbi:DUF1206 domain-containing protein [Nocardia pseudobrasiliensis]|uniref:Uncharacterized protein DUF1206 n=1 Tax=Nocardia pseudobrasiliensis TaxID=45979 RepID=A0A370HTL6_9NOCA|nr:DUF1206 domain-containing protein [Nocardia pseudobrasiliensis]RDI60304.1 uncharacterized protein DUF1206 [Nocardia pseudobrasiliensis]
MSVLSGGQSGSRSDTASRFAQNSVLERFARGGFVMTGIVHLIIGYIAIRIAIGGGGGTADQTGAMAEIAAKPFGRIALWIAVIAFAALGVWRLAEAVFGSASKPDKDSTRAEAFRRAKAAALAVIYFAFAVSASVFARGGGKSSSGQSTGITARLMQHTAGTIALILVGLVIVAVGGYHAYKGVTRKFLDDLRGPTGTAVRRLGTGGYIAKGLAVGAVGLLVILAVTRSEPEKAGGLDAAFKSLGAQPYGVLLLIVAALGIIAYGLYCFVMARLAKM